MIKTMFITLGAMAAGAAMMYLFDPQGGRRRRALVRDKAVGIKNDVKDAVEGTVTDLSNRTQGVLHEVKSLGESVAPETSQSQNF